VICTTGPIEVANSLYDTYVMTSNDINKKVRPATFSHYNLHKAFLSKNVIPLHENPWSMLKFLGADVGELNDSSWLEEGMNLQQVRQQKLLEKQQQLRDGLPLLLVKTKCEIEAHLQKLEGDAKGWFGFWDRARRQAKIEAIKSVLECFDKENQTFDINRFRAQVEKMDKKTVFSGFFTRTTEALITHLEQFCHDSIVLRVAKDKKLSLVTPYEFDSVLDVSKCASVVEMNPTTQQQASKTAYKKPKAQASMPSHCLSSFFAASAACADQHPASQLELNDSQRMSCAG
jgi:glucosyltransferase Lgt1/2/3